MIVLVLPAYNEFPDLAELLSRIVRLQMPFKQSLRIIVVDDGSEDSTIESLAPFNNLNIEVVRHAQNLGLSAALRTGLSKAIASADENDVILTMDADNTHPPDLISTMVEKIRDGADIVIASRYQAGAKQIGVSRLRGWLSTAARLMIKLCYPIPGVRDYTCGYRAYRAKLLKRGSSYWKSNFIDQPGFSCMLDMLIKLSGFNPAIVEAPLILRYDRKSGPSKMRIGKTMAETMILLVRRRLQRNNSDQSIANYLSQLQ